MAKRPPVLPLAAAVGAATTMMTGTVTVEWAVGMGTEVIYL
jgi:hypothetical protein